MSHGQKCSLREMGFRKIQEMADNGIGTSKHDDKVDARKNNLDWQHSAGANKIYSYTTAHNYRVAWERYYESMKRDGYKVQNKIGGLRNPATLEEAAGYMPQYLETLKNSDGKSAGSRMSSWTIREYFAGPAKIMGLSARDYDLPSRHYSEITRSRGEKISDTHFSDSNHADLLEFARSTGVRHSELNRLRGDQLRCNADGSYSIEIKGKGGKVRQAQICASSPADLRSIVDRMQSAGSGLVWHDVPQFDCHSCRRDYCQRVYNSAARPVSQLSKSERYCCRKDSHHIYDRKALAYTSRQMGHNRVGVIAGHYLAR